MRFEVAVIALAACAVITSRLVRRRRREGAAYRRELALRKEHGAEVFRYRVVGSDDWIRLGIARAGAAASKTITLDVDPDLRLESFDGTLWRLEPGELRLEPLAEVRWLDVAQDRSALLVPNGTELLVLATPRTRAESDAFRNEGSSVLAAYDGKYLAAPSDARAALEVAAPAEPRSRLKLNLFILLVVYSGVHMLPAAVGPWVVGAGVLFVGIFEAYAWLAGK